MQSRTPGLRQAGLPVILCVFVSACAGSPAPTQPSGQTPAGVSGPREGFVSQTGFVLDFRTYAPLAGARVIFGSFTTGGSEYAAVADGSGIYRIEVPPGDYLVRIDGVTVTGLKATASSTRAHLFAGAEGCSALYGVVDGVRSGTPLEGVVVTSGGSTRATTAADGWYRLDFGCGVNLGFNTMYAYFTHPGYQNGSHVVGRGAPRGARRIDMVLQPATSGASE